MRRLPVVVSLSLGLAVLAPLGASAHPMDGRQVDGHQAGRTGSRVRYVSPTGDDGAAGTQQAPLRTPQVAVDQLTSGGYVRLLPGTYHQARIVIQGRQDLTISATTPGTVVLDEKGLTPPDGDSGAVQIENSTDIAIRGLDIRNYRTTSMAKVPIGIYVTGHGSRITIAQNHVHRMGNYNTTRGSFDINAHGIAVYGRNAKHPIKQLRIRRNEVDHLHLGASESVVVNGNVRRWQIVGNRIHDDDNIGIDVIGWEGTVPGKHRYTQVDQARHGVISGNIVRRIISRGNPAYWEGDGWCNCADGIYVDGGGRVKMYANVVAASDIGIEVGAENPRGYADHVQVLHNDVSGSGYVGLALGGYSRSRGEVDHVLVTGNHFRNNNTLRDGSPELLLQYHLHEIAILDNTVIATHRATPVLLQRDRLDGGHRLNAHVRLDHNRYSAPVKAARAQFLWEGQHLTGFASYVRRSGQDAHSHYRQAPPG